MSEPGNSNTSDSPTVSTAPTATTKQKADKGATQVSKLLKLAGGCDLFHDPSNVPFVTCKVKSHTENYPVHSHDFEAWLMHGMYTSYGTTPTSQALKSALGVLHGKACFGGPAHQVHVRVADHQGDIIIDLGDADWK